MRLIKSKKTLKKVNSITNKIFNEDCFSTMQKMKQGSCDLVITSPPYNTSRNNHSERALKNHEGRYDIFVDSGTHEDYVNWTTKLFNKFNEILVENGVVLYNLNYGNDGNNSTCDNLIDTIHSISTNTNFMVSDIIVWKKSSALPNNTSKNKCTRIWEFIFVLCRKSENKTYNSGKKIKSVAKTGQNFYTNMFNFIEAPNNDGSCKLNKATFSSNLVLQLLDMYAPSKDIVVYDPFIGTGTTAVACKEFGCKYIGSELSKAQCEYAIERIENIE